MPAINRSRRLDVLLVGAIALWPEEWLGRMSLVVHVSRGFGVGIDLHSRCSCGEFWIAGGLYLSRLAGEWDMAGGLLGGTGFGRL